MGNPNQLYYHRSIIFTIIIDQITDSEKMKIMKIAGLLKVIPVATVIFLMLIASVEGKSKPDGLAMAVKMADSEITQFPDPWTVDYNPKPVWNYTQGLIAQAMLQLWEATGNRKYYEYAKAYADKMIDPTGFIQEYKLEDYNIDRLNPGKYLFDLYTHTKDERYKKAIITLREQLKSHPRTSEGGFWHKKIYPWQMWLDGLYMGAPFYARYARDFNEPDAFEDVISQFVIVHWHTYNPETGLNYHGWDEKKVQKWADPVTGCSPNFWGRAIGWYAMALVDVLDFIPENHPRRGEILQILLQVVDGIQKVQDQGKREGNYLEATASSMFSYALLKAVRIGYIAPKYRKTAVKGYNGIVRHLIRENSDGSISLTKCCAVAGLGGNPYRDGSYEYYIRETVRDNDPKGVGPFIMAGLEMNLLK
jgi:unsaturated rhamnogalacturonyl hydrolase